MRPSNTPILSLTAGTLVTTPAGDGIIVDTEGTLIACAVAGRVVWVQRWEAIIRNDADFTTLFCPAWALVVGNVIADGNRVGVVAGVYADGAAILWQDQSWGVAKPYEATRVVAWAA
jgi:hypothetical protein